MDDVLLEKVNPRLGVLGYSTRYEAVRDLVRKALDDVGLGVIALVFDPRNPSCLKS